MGVSSICHDTRLACTLEDVSYLGLSRGLSNVGAIVPVARIVSYVIIAEPVFTFADSTVIKEPVLGVSENRNSRCA